MYNKVTSYTIHIWHFDRLTKTKTTEFSKNLFYNYSVHVSLYYIY